MLTFPLSVCNVSRAWVKYKNKPGCSSLAVAFYKRGMGQQFRGEGGRGDSHELTWTCSRPSSKTRGWRTTHTDRAYDVTLYSRWNYATSSLHSNFFYSRNLKRMNFEYCSFKFNAVLTYFTLRSHVFLVKCCFVKDRHQWLLLTSLVNCQILTVFLIVDKSIVFRVWVNLSLNFCLNEFAC